MPDTPKPNRPILDPPRRDVPDGYEPAPAGVFGQLVDERPEHHGKPKQVTA